MEKKNSNKDQAGAEELDILHPDRSATLGGRKVTVREYGFIEGMRLLPTMQPFLDALHQRLVAGKDTRFQDALMLMAEHIDLVVEMVAVAADVDKTWIESLQDHDGEHLLMLWWGANASFFFQKVRNRIGVERAEAEFAKLAGAKSTQPSLPTDTTPASSEATPPVS